MALKPTAISWKNNEEDESLRKWVHSHSNYSGCVKDILRIAMNNEESQYKENAKSNKENELIDLGDF